MEQDYKQLFVGGDLSGIQNFLYNISSKKAAVSLIGRSEYLSRYMKDVCSKVEEAALLAGSQKPDVIYKSGGKFYMIVSNTPAVRQAIEGCAESVKQALWQKHQGELGIGIAYVAFTEHADGLVDTEGLTRQEPGLLWQTVNADFYRQKHQKFADMLQADYDHYFEPIPIGGQAKVCAVTGIESTDCIAFEDMYVLPSVDEQMQLGMELRKKQGFKDFKDYANGTYLGILRMDVDGLGQRFIKGFKSIGEYKTFSGKLEQFFVVETKNVQRTSEFSDYLNIIYAGGDDLFVVGRWDKVIDFAERIHIEVDARFGQDGITISGGVAIVAEKFPIAKSAELAGKAEDAAKAYDDGKGQKKNAFCFLGKTVSWKEFPEVKRYQEQFVSLIGGNNLSKGILHKIMLYASIADQNKVRRREGKAEDFSYVWHLSYYLTRYMTRYKDNDAVCNFCRRLRDKELNYKDGRKLELIALAARWAELKMKDKEV